jgi:glycosyltransferase involved in cell wall biosynthesis
MVRISVVVITFNEERNLDRCLSSVHGVADDIVVLDSRSTDRTRAIAERHGARVYHHDFDDHASQKNRAMAHASYPYILSLDADEALSDELRETILRIKNDWTADAYSMNRRTNYCGSWITHGGWYPDRKVRLFDRRVATWRSENDLHERIVLSEGARFAHIAGDLLHYSYYTREDHLRQIERFTDIMSRAMHRAGERSNILEAATRSAFKFVRDYVLKLGILDGSAGFTVAWLSAWATWVKYRKVAALEGKHP